jgi:hypothetical protein
MRGEGEAVTIVIGVPLPPCGGGDRGEGAVGIERGAPDFANPFTTLRRERYSSSVNVTLVPIAPSPLSPPPRGGRGTLDGVVVEAGPP